MRIIEELLVGCTCYIEVYCRYPFLGARTEMSR